VPRRDPLQRVPDPQREPLPPRELHLGAPLRRGRIVPTRGR
jgi:hypothetical protein